MAEELEYHVLRALHETSGPMGSGLVAEILRANGVGVSEATVGRVLRALTLNGLAERVAYRGRMLTPEGEDRLLRLRIRREGRAYGEELMAYVQAVDQETLKDVLVARRAIEAETAALAATRASEAEVQHMRDLLEAASGKILNDTKEYSYEHDLGFHVAIATAARNRLLELALNLVRRNDWLFPAFTYIRTKSGSKVLVDHFQILEAIAAHDPERARGAMVSHLNRVISDVEKWSSLPHSP